MKTLEPPSSAGTIHATSQIRGRDPLWTTQHGGSGGLPYEVGCRAFTRDLRQFQWPSHRTFKPDVGEKYNGKTHPSEFLSIYTIAMQAAGARDDKVLANYFPLALKPNVMSWLMHLRWIPFLLGRICVMSSLVPSPEPTKLMARRVICISFPRRKAKTCASTYRGSTECNTTSQMFTLPP